MRIVWDEPKRLANLAKHGLDFQELEHGFDFAEAIIRPARVSRHGHPRWRATGPLNGRIVSVIFRRLARRRWPSSVCGRHTGPRGKTMTAGKRGYQPNPDYTQQDWDEVSDNPEWTAEDFKKARPFKEVFPELYESWRRTRGAQKAPTKQLVSLRLDPDVIAHFKAQGAGWQTRINRALRKVMADASGAK